MVGELRSNMPSVVQAKNKEIKQGEGGPLTEREREISQWTGEYGENSFREVVGAKVSLQKIMPKHTKRYSKLLVIMCMLSHVRLFVAPWAVARQAPLSVEFSRQEYWSGLPFPTPGDLPNLGIEPMSPASPALAGGFFTTASSGKLSAIREM